MRDTTPDIERRLAAMIAERSPGERLRMASDMFSSARALLRAGLLRQNPALSDEVLKTQVFLRLYGEDFTGVEASRIISGIPGMSD